MGSKKLIDTNPYLRDPVERARLIFRSVASSSAIEGIHHQFRPASKSQKRTKTARRSTKP